jgi:hypothetical protein
MLWIIIFLIIELLIIISIVTSIYSFFRAVVIRFSFLKKLRELASRKGYTLTEKRKRVASLFKHSSLPDIVFEAEGKKYLIRFITCFKRKRFYHFANAEYFAYFAKIFFVLPLAKKEEDLKGNERFRRIPPLDEQYADLESQVVLLFNPAPVEITYGSKVISNGDHIENCIIYSAKGFLELFEK